MPLDPNVAAFLQFVESMGQPQMWEGTPEVARAAIRTLMVDLIDPSTLPVVASIEPLTINGSIPARVYRPETSNPVPTVVYLHGGGFVIGDLDTHDGVCRRLCRDVEAVIVSVDYALAPENRFPRAVEDSYAAFGHVAAHIDDFGGDGSRIAIGGDRAVSTGRRNTLIERWRDGFFTASKAGSSLSRAHRVARSSFGRVARGSRQVLGCDRKRHQD